MNIVRRVYRGRLTLSRHPISQREDDPTFLEALATEFDAECGEPWTSLAHQIKLAAEQCGRTVSICYNIRQTRQAINTKNPFGADWTWLYGTVSAEGYATKGTRLGSWVVRERIEIDGKDFLAELRAKAGQFCHMEIVYQPITLPDKT